MTFKKNFHLAKKCVVQKIIKEIRNYPKKYPTPKYLIFIKKFLDLGFQVRLYKAKISKYVFIVANGDIIKIRFSNHRPIKIKEIENDCDYYVGVSNFQVLTTEKLIENILERIKK